MAAASQFFQEAGIDLLLSLIHICNRKTAREPAGELAYAANGRNQYTGIEESGEAPFVPTYDASGNQYLIKTSTGIWTAVYNAANRAVSFTSRDGATVVECGYDNQSPFP